MKSHIKGIVFGVMTASLVSGSVLAEDWQGDTKDAWIDGKLEASYLLNSELNNFRINTDVENGKVLLTGSVPSDAHKELAAEIAKNLDGVVDVTNELEVGETGEEYADNDREFSSRFYDMTTTVSLKSNFAANDELEASEINIDTKEGVVTLEGEVDSKAESMLAEEIASGYDHVSKVNNNLRVVASTD
ncbi:MAG: BON domain-containing protein [Pseudomonadota bacterium]